MDFQLHPQLAADTAFIADWPVSRLLAMNDKRFPWIMLVPRRGGVSELFDLDPADRVMVVEEVARAGAALKALTGCAKINIGALGNAVPQLHIHIVARSPGDAAWPGPVWGSGPPRRYDPEELAEFVAGAVNVF